MSASKKAKLAHPNVLDFGNGQSDGPLPPALALSHTFRREEEAAHFVIQASLHSPTSRRRQFEGRASTSLRRMHLQTTPLVRPAHRTHWSTVTTPAGSGRRLQAFYRQVISVVTAGLLRVYVHTRTGIADEHSFLVVSFAPGQGPLQIQS